MSAPLAPCAWCHRHVKAGQACPFCGEASAVPPGGFGHEAGPGGPVSQTDEARLQTIYGMPAIREPELVPAPHYGMPPARNPVVQLVAVLAVGGAVAYYVLR